MFQIANTKLMFFFLSFPEIKIRKMISVGPNRGAKGGKLLL